MGERVKDVYVTWERCEKEVYVMRDMKKNVYVMGERGYLSRTSRPPKRVFSPTPPPSLENRKRVFTSNI
jgi:hypothetical protein